jgi:hypothetical protein
MTSPLRRKRPTTRPSFRRMSEDGRRPELDCGLRIADCGLRCAFVAAICMLVVTLSTSFTAASDLVWRSGRGENAEPVAKLAVKQAAAKSSTTATAATEPKQAANALKFVRPSSLHVDSAVRQTAFEEDAPRLNRVPASDAGTRSIVVNRDDAADVFRSAQLTSGSSTSGGMSSSNTPTSPAADGLRSPFTETPGEPQLPTPQLETPNIPDGEAQSEQPTAQPGAGAGQPAKPLRQPAGPQQPAPRQYPNNAGQFQPVLPAGPTIAPSGPPAPSTPTATIEAERGTAKESCDKSLENLRSYTVDKVNLNIRINGTEGQDFPFECSIDDGSQFQGRCWDQITYQWKASALCHKPLYFEDEQLERYGHSFSPAFQPFISGAHFFCTLPVLPYCMGVEPPCECIYALGHYRPGSCTPYMCNPIPLSARGALFETGGVWAAAAILP